jgi:DNA polymerase-3 subunit gamma/tau
MEMTLLRMLAFRPADSGSAIGGYKVSAGAGGDSVQRTASATAAQSALPSSDSQKVARTDSQRALQPALAPDSAEGETLSHDEAPAEAANADWISLARKLDLKGSVRELARNVHLRSRNEDEWEFVISHSLRHLGSETCVDRLRQALSKQLGHAVMVRVVDSEEVGLPTEAKLEERQLHTKLSDAERAINEDPTVKSLKEQFGARIVEDSIQPLQ